ncbi:MAG: substrate-binding domain-containing protein [Flexilinea flocculi]|nr:substrate-binding domain-containing protein [Flexilinea flocculi]
MLLLVALILIMNVGVVSAADEPVYGLFMSHMTNAFTMEMSTAVQTKADELGVKLTVYDGGKDPAKQINQIETAISQGIAAIIVEPASVDGIIPAVKAAREAGIPVVILNQKITDQSIASTFVGVSNVDGGKMEMSAAVADMGGEGKVALLLGPMGSDAQIGRSEGYQAIIDESKGKVEVVYELTANWTTDEALAVVETWLSSGKEINAIVAQNDGMAMGALKAVEDAKMEDKILVYGLDATDEALAAVKDGRLKATVSQSTTLQGLKAMEAAVDLVNGKEVAPEILVDFTLITKDNVDEFLK